MLNKKIIFFVLMHCMDSSASAPIEIMPEIIGIAAAASSDLAKNKPTSSVSSLSLETRNRGRRSSWDMRMSANVKDHRHSCSSEDITIVTAENSSKIPKRQSANTENIRNRATTAGSVHAHLDKLTNIKLHYQTNNNIESAVSNLITIDLSNQDISKGLFMFLHEVRETHNNRNYCQLIFSTPIKTPAEDILFNLIAKLQKPDANAGHVATTNSFMSGISKSNMFKLMAMFYIMDSKESSFCLRATNTAFCSPYLEWFTIRNLSYLQSFITLINITYAFWYVYISYVNWQTEQNTGSQLAKNAYFGSLVGTYTLGAMLRGLLDTKFFKNCHYHHEVATIKQMIDAVGGM